MALFTVLKISRIQQQKLKPLVTSVKTDQVGISHRMRTKCTNKKAKEFSEKNMLQEMDLKELMCAFEVLKYVWGGLCLYLVSAGFGVFFVFVVLLGYFVWFGFWVLFFFQEGRGRKKPSQQSSSYILWCSKNF